MTVALALVRAAHFLSLMAIFGSETLRALLRARLKPAPASLVPESLFQAAAGIAFATAILWLALTAAQAMGDAGAATDPRQIWTIATTTSFGPFLLARIVACGFLLTATFVPGAERARLLLSGFALADIAFTSHAAASGESFVLLRTANDAVHLLAAGFWIGALVELAPFAIRYRGEAETLVPPMRVFSQWGTVAVALLITAGALNGVMILYAAPQLWSSLYLTLLAIKIVLAALMVALALANRFSLLPGIRAGHAEAAQNLVGSVIAELATGAIVVGIVGFLGILAPLTM